VEDVPKPAPWWMSPKLAAVVIAVLAFVPFVPAIGGEFVFDDHIAIVNNQAVTSDFSLTNIFDSGFWGGNEQNNSGSYRPITVLTFAIDYRLGGGEPWIFHLDNILFHVLTALACFVVIRRRWGHGVGVAVAMVFATHALHVENVGGLVGRADVLATFFGLLAWDLAGRKSARLAACSGVALLVSLLAKEVGVAFLGVVVAEEVLRLRRGERPMFGRLVPIATMLAALAIYLLLRLEALGSLTADVSAQGNPLVDASALERVLTASMLLTKTFELMVFPAVLCADYSYAEIMPIGSPWDPQVLSGLALWLLLPLTAVVFRRKAPGTSSGLIVFLAAYAPISNLVLQVPTIFAERLLYLPSLGLFLAAVTALRPLWGQRRRLLVAVLAIAVLGNGARSFVRSFDWQTARSLFDSATRVAPLSARNWFNLGVAALAEEKPEEALEHLEKSLAIVPNQPLAHSYIGVALDKLDRPKEAHVAMYRSVRMQPWCKLCAMNIVNLYIKYGFFQDARDELARYQRAGGEPGVIANLAEKIDYIEAKARREGEPERRHPGPN